MRIDAICNFDPKIIYNDFYFKRIYFANDAVTRLLSMVDSKYETDITDLLNTINNQNIEAISFKNYQYKHRGIWLGFSKFSKAERVFLIAGVADLVKQEIWLYTDITQLTRSTLKKFIRKFYDSPYINIIYASESSKAFYNAMIREALK